MAASLARLVLGLEQEGRLPFAWSLEHAGDPHALRHAWQAEGDPNDLLALVAFVSPRVAARTLVVVMRKFATNVLGGPPPSAQDTQRFLAALDRPHDAEALTRARNAFVSGLWDAVQRLPAARREHVLDGLATLASELETLVRYEPGGEGILRAQELAQQMTEVAHMVLVRAGTARSATILSEEQVVAALVRATVPAPTEQQILRATRR